MQHFVWNINPILLEFGFLKIRWYGAMFATAFVFCYSMMQWVYQREGKDVEELDRLLWYTAIGTVLGARLAHVFIYDPAFYLAHPSKILAIWEGGLASHGANIGILLALYFYKRGTDYSYLWLLDRVAFPCAMGGCFIRIGNFFNSEILGTVTNQPWGIIFARVDDLPRHPVQLYEAFCYALIFFILLQVYKKTYDKPIRGLIFGLFTTLVFLVRIFLEFFKTEQAMYESDLPLTTGQLLSVPFVLVGIGFVIWSLINYRKAICQ
ncbi:prolipoprotein diacylglyceryl transferase [Methylomonas paludis]|uniref:Phosphatidylglycerol--prolipoprotein diacylglyceryl transferase n=1 Tax=Methylomonas paludis TaxID=1173101 RepID=A0A975MLG6_9GAMM|nr:prolipoprotein diacylglyceryl transferase [Methylomonas paludis]QWF69987.1 prolipoprotein diacylglyceryl transferase [Methylomonas paludis]